MARDDARPGKALQGLLERYSGKWSSKKAQDGGMGVVSPYRHLVLAVEQQRDSCSSNGCAIAGVAGKQRDTGMTKAPRCALWGFACISAIGKALVVVSLLAVLLAFTCHDGGKTWADNVFSRSKEAFT